jgi:cytochrome P450
MINALQGTGDTEDDFKFIGIQTEFSRNTQVHSGRLITYDVPYEKSAAPTKRPSARSFMPPGAEESGKVVSQRYALNHYLAKAREEARRMKEESQYGNTLDLGIRGVALLDDLEELWRLRTVRELEWAEILNLLQSALAKEQFERFTPHMCNAVLKVVSEYLGSGATDRDDVRDALRILQDAALDPWKAISTPAETSK